MTFGENSLCRGIVGCWFTAASPEFSQFTVPRCCITIAYRLSKSLFLPNEWAVYIETPGLSYERHPMEGFIAHLDYNLFSRGVDLQFAMFLRGRDQPRMVALPLGEGTLLDAMDRIDEVDSIFSGDTSNIRYIGSRDEYRGLFPLCFSWFCICAAKNLICPKLNTLSNAEDSPGASAHLKSQESGM